MTLPSRRTGADQPDDVSALGSRNGQTVDGDVIPFWGPTG